MRCKNSRLSIVEHNVIGHSGAHAETFSRHICNNINVIVNPSLICYQTSYFYVQFYNNSIPHYNRNGGTRLYRCINQCHNMLMVLRWIIRHSANCSLHLRSIQGLLVRIATMGTMQNGLAYNKDGGLPWISKSTMKVRKSYVMK
jgi:hypothetical protein